MILAFFEKHLIWTNGKKFLYYYDEITWIVAALVLAWIVWYFVSRYLRAKSLRRAPRSNNVSALRKIVKIKNELTARWLCKGASKKIHAIGIGKLPNGEYCIQIFINDANEPPFNANPTEQIPNVYKNIPLIIVAMPNASFLSAENHFANFSTDAYRKLIRGHQETIIGGISGANANLDNNSGTIGYFCRKKSFITRRSEIYLLSNSHVFADLRRMNIEAHDFILQPSPGEGTNSRPIAELTQLSPLKFDNDVTDANFIDVAIAKLFHGQSHKFLLPFIGEIKRFVKKEDAEIGEKAQKFGRTTGYTSGNLFSVALDIWIKYDRTGKVAFFADQFLVETDKTNYEKFVDKGDSGSLLVDEENNAVGLIFAGANGKIDLKDSEQNAQIVVNNYGVANPISEVMNKMKIELVFD
ncbi:MAG TPA: hypothetical protein PKE69_13125 [Pyrinomonadaceae bacterium]|nr:hypothetical protein [Pyrinomonadaceae bacterium]